MVDLGNSGIREQHATIDGVSVHYASAGQGPPVVLIHGLAGNLYFWRRNLEALGKHFAVYALDLPGHGGSDEPPEYSLSYGARLVARFLDYLSLPRASLVGSSLGGLVALGAAHAFPERVERLVLVDSAGLCQHIPWLLRLLTVPGLGEVLAHPTRLALRLSLRQMLYRPGEASVWQLWGNSHYPWRARALLQIVRHGSDLRGLKPWARWDGRLDQIRPPTLIVWGAEDRIFAVGHALEAHRMLPGSRLVVMPRCGHLPQWENPEAFNRVVIEFLKGE